MLLFVCVGRVLCQMCDIVEHLIPILSCCSRGWLGDAQWTSEEASLNLDTGLFYENFVRTMGDTQAVGCEHVPLQSQTPTWKLSPGQSRPPTYECCSKQHPTFGCDWTGVNDSFADTRGALPDVVPYSRKTYGGTCPIPDDPRMREPHSWHGWYPAQADSSPSTAAYAGWPGDPSWMAAAAEIPYQAWKKSGDDIALGAAYPVARDLVEFLTRHIDPSIGLPIFG